MRERHKSLSRMLVAWAAMVAIAVASSAMFVGQGGFGRGHLALDLPIFILALPWVLVPSVLPPWDIVVEVSDFVWFVALPFAGNSALCAVVYCVLRVRARRKSAGT